MNPIEARIAAMPNPADRIRARIAALPSVERTPQIRPTSQPIIYWQPSEVKLLVAHPATPVYRKDGQLAKRQPAPWKPGDQVFARLGFDGLVSLMPFSMAGSGYEIITDAIEGTHYEFMA